MSSSHDMEGRQVDEKEMAKALGFVSIEAMREWRVAKETVTVEKLLVNLVNLRQEVKWLKDKFNDSGCQKVGY